RSREAMPRLSHRLSLARLQAIPTSKLQCLLLCLPWRSAGSLAALARSRRHGMTSDKSDNRSSGDAEPLLFVNASQVVTCGGPGRARRGSEMSDVGIRTEVGVVIEDGCIVAIDAPSTLSERFPTAREIDCGQRVLMPGLVDSHTHAIFGRPRYEEQEM